jgi:PTH2 family peptidyl-tRNA hydrolase
MACKQVIVLRKDLGMRRGKMVAQGAHASQLAIMNALEDGRPQHWRDWYSFWMRGAFTKICVSVDTEGHLLDLVSAAETLSVPMGLVRDSGLTEFHGIPTYTAMCVGPAPSELLDGLTGKLPLL